MKKMETYPHVVSRRFGEYILQRRKEPKRNMKQAELAEKLEISAQFLGEDRKR